MIARDDIIIRKAILHILDTMHGQCILSNTLLDPGPDLYEFIRSHIYKIVVSDDTKDCEFNPETSPIYPILTAWDESDEESFIATSQAIAEKLYTSMGEGLDIPAADLLFVTFQAEGVIYLALLKMNYKESYTHEISVSDIPAAGVFSDTDIESDTDVSSGATSKEEPATTEVRADIVKSRALLPASGTRIPEAIIINLDDMHIKLLEKRYEVTIICFSSFFTVDSLVTVKLSNCKSYCSIFSSNSDFFSGLFPKSRLPISSTSKDCRSTYSF